MGRVKEKPIWKFSIAGVQDTPTRSKVTARGHSCVVDEPVQRGGTDLGPMPVEYVFMGLAGCTHVITNKLAAAHGVTITAMEIDINVTMDSHGTRLIRPIEVPFPEAVLDIRVSYEGAREDALKMARSLREHCAVSKMLQESGTRVVENWELNGESLTID
ncbi:MAG: hypothetical protein D6754_00715 [Alphaproteobacteria bacterium]|nr:MAG: hypothetical protein D6754_00715 [Alphaproteobacteria bacterium]